MTPTRITKQSILHPVRAKFYQLPDGSLKLASLQAFNQNRFRESGWEDVETEFTKKSKAEEITEEEEKELAEKLDIEHVANKERATRRARKNAFDLIMCNNDLDVFATFTYSPEKVEDKADYSECYKYLGRWLQNRVQRNGLKYVCVPERTKKGDIQFHGIMNSTALKMIPAYSAKTGKPLRHNGKPLYNIADWQRGFSSCEYITALNVGEDARSAVSKYIFKYMGKQSGQKIGGRYCLIGGKLNKPFYAYAESPEEFFTGEDRKDTAIYTNHVELSNGLTYDEWSFT